jgi:hypothetical protein
MTAVYVLIGAGVARGLEEGGVPWKITAVVAALGLALVFVVKAARSKLKEAAEETPGVQAEELETEAQEAEHE